MTRAVLAVLGKPIWLTPRAASQHPARGVLQRRTRMPAAGRLPAVDLLLVRRGDARRAARSGLGLLPASAISGWRG